MRAKSVNKRKKSLESGQAALEFVLVMPVMVAAIFLIVVIAVGWHAHALGAALAIEGTSMDSYSPGSGSGLVGRLATSSAFPMSGSGSGTSIVGYPGITFSVRGTYSFPLQPFGLDLSASLLSSASSPRWIFVP